MLLINVTCVKKKKKSWAIALSHLIVNVLGKTITIRNSKWMKNAFYPPFKQCSCIFYPSCLRYINYDCICKYLCCCVVAFFILSSFFLSFFFLFLLLEGLWVEGTVIYELSINITGLTQQVLVVQLLVMGLWKCTWQTGSYKFNNCKFLDGNKVICTEPRKQFWKSIVQLNVFSLR